MPEQRASSKLLADVARIVKGADDDVLHRVAQVAAELLGARQAAIALWTWVEGPEGGEPGRSEDEGRASVAVHLADAAGGRQARSTSGEPAVAQVARWTGGALRLSAAEATTDAELRTRLANATTPLSGLLAVPLTGAEGRPMGRIALSHPEKGDFTEQDQELLVAFAEIVAAALEQQRRMRRMEEAQRLRDAFFGVVSHELRTPITTIYGGTHVLRRSDGRMSHDARQQLFEDVAEEAERLYRLVEDLLVLSRAERGGSAPGAEPILLQHVVPRVVASERRRWPRGRLHVDAPMGIPPASGDEVLVEQVLRNLLSNAMKYAGDLGPVEVSANASGGWVEVRVSDQGPGIDSEMVERVFELFFRAPDAPSKAQGAGIGLYVCRELVRSMGGDVWVRARVPRGAEFGFRLREYATESAEQAIGSGPAGSRRGQHGEPSRPTSSVGTDLV